MTDALDTAPADWTVGEVVTAAKMNTELRDKMLAIAARLDDTGRVDINTAGFTPYTNFSSLNGWARRKNGIVQVSFTIVTTNGLGSGNVTNTAICNIPAGWDITVGGAMVGGAAYGPVWQGYALNGLIVVSAIGSTAINAGDTFSCYGMWFVD